jgi:hypothetical protein
VPAAFVPGLQLAREFYAAEVRPLLRGQFPEVPHAAALVGAGSEVASFDTERSTDHDWGPRLQVFLRDGDGDRYAAAITAMLGDRLPESFRGYPVAFPVTREPGELTRARAALTWYPHDLWLHLLACQWQRIGQEESFPGRCAEVGDDLGSRIVAARLARDLMRLVLLMHRRYPPYSKWLGTAFARLPGIAELTASLTAAVSGASWPAREQCLRDAYQAVAALHNRLRVTAPLDVRTSLFYRRPYQVIDAGRFTTALREAITDPHIKRLPIAVAIDQVIDNTDAGGDLRFLRACAAAAIR